MSLDTMCNGLDSPEKELCVLCWGETDPARRRMCYKVLWKQNWRINETSSVPGSLLSGHPGVPGHLPLSGDAVSPVCAGQLMHHPIPQV